VNFDGIVGPTHNYAGLSYGNLASQKHRLSASNPKEAALQGLRKMKFLADLGVKQAVLPPQPRPDLATLRRVGFHGSDADVLRQAHHEHPRLLAACYSSSSMWAANAATVSPSADAQDGRAHFTPANLITQFHRSIEPPHTAAVLRRIFADESMFVHHPPLPATAWLADEGAANHTRLCGPYGSRGIEIFVYGRSSSATRAPATFPARQTLEASRAVARLHGLEAGATIFAHQHPATIDAGVFHNDLVAVGNQNVLLYHAAALAEEDRVVAEVRQAFALVSDQPLHLVRVSEEQVPLAEAVQTYLFNSQVVTLPDGAMAVIAPVECGQSPNTAAFLQQLTQMGTAIRAVYFLDVRQSMQNGGGPACLRLRVVLTQDELARMHQGILLTDALYHDLVSWVEKHYRDRIASDDLVDPALAEESRAALDALWPLLKWEAKD
jgi:succinylarginine dihydrolase